jgi:hypothetical protein
MLIPKRKGGESMRQLPVHRPDGYAAGSDNGNDDPSAADTRIAAAEALAAQAVSRYRDTIAAAPGLITEMVQGNTIEEIDASAEAARQAYNEVSRRIALQHERELPTGNPARSGSTVGAEALKPEAKIALGLRSRT